MAPVLQFFIALAIAGTTLVGGSLAWPRFTTQARPKLLADVRELALKTSVGIKSAAVLGVSDESHIEPINMQEIVASAAAGVRQGVQGRIQKIIVGNAVNQLSRQFDMLPKEQKEQIQQIFCQTTEP